MLDAAFAQAAQAAPDAPSSMDQMIRRIAATAIAFMCAPRMKPA